MDHVLNAIMPYYELTLDQFVEEHKNGKYKKLSDNPFYTELKALIDAVNVLRKYLNLKQIRLKDEIDFY